MKKFNTTGPCIPQKHYMADMAEPLAEICAMVRRGDYFTIYLDRELKNRTAFQSVILASIYDIRNIRRKIRPDEERRFNSPWNIAADFDVKMSLSRRGIAGMLSAYESDRHTGMDIGQMASLLYEYTSGYPFLVSRLCWLMDEKVSRMEPYILKNQHGHRKDSCRLSAFCWQKKIIL